VLKLTGFSAFDYNYILCNGYYILNITMYIIHNEYK